MINEKEAQSAFNFYFPRLSGCTSFADSIHSVSDLRFHLSILQLPSFIIAVVHSIGNDDVIHEMQAHGFTSFID